MQFSEETTAVRRPALHTIVLTDISAVIIIISTTQLEFILFERNSTNWYNIFQTEISPDSYLIQQRVGVS